MNQSVIKRIANRGERIAERGERIEVSSWFFIRYPLYAIRYLLFTFYLLLSTFLPFYLSTCLYSVEPDSSTLLQEKMRIEKDYEKRIIEIVEKIVGPGKAVVFVSAELQSVKLSGKTEQAQGTAEQANPFLGVKPKPKVLPGFEAEVAPEVQQPAAGSEKSAGKAQKAERIIVSTMLRALKVTILLDKGIQEAKKLIIKEAITQSVGSDVGGGKFTLEIKEAPFTTTSFWAPFLEPKVLVPLILGIIFLIVLMGPLHSVLQSFANAFKESRKGGEFTVLSKSETESKGETKGEGAGSGGGGGGGGVGGAAGASVTIKEEEEEEMKKKEKPFEYITKENLKNLIYLLQEETPEVIALVITYLNPEFAAEVVAALPSDLQLQTAVCLANVKLTSEEDVTKINDKIKKNIDFLVGGMDAFIKILGQVENRIRKEMLSTLEKQSPRLAKIVRENVFMFEDIANLPDQTVQFIMREVKTDQLAIALKGAGMDAVMQKVLANMSEGGRLLLKEEMDFGRPVSPQQIEEAQRDIEKIIKRMETERKIVLRMEEKKGTAVVIEGRLQKLDIGDEYRTQPQPSQQQTQQTQSPPQTQQPQVSPQRAIEYYNAGITAYSSGKIDDAIHYFQRSVEYNPNFWQAWQYLGSCLYSKGRIEEAIKSYERSLAANPSNTQLRDWLATEKQKRLAAK
ncbi:MAG: FliG C-terminal domain-containing protein [Elusimicrobiota bacterium]